MRLELKMKIRGDEGSRIMIVDSRHEIEMRCREILKGRDIDIITAANSQKAMEKFILFKPVLFIINDNLPEIDGWYIHDRLVLFFINPEFRVILVSDDPVRHNPKVFKDRIISIFKTPVNYDELTRLIDSELSLNC